MKISFTNKGVLFTGTPLVLFKKQIVDYPEMQGKEGVSKTKKEEILQFLLQHKYIFYSNFYAKTGSPIACLTASLIAFESK